MYVSTVSRDLVMFDMIMMPDKIDQYDHASVNFVEYCMKKISVWSKTIELEADYAVLFVTLADLMNHNAGNIDKWWLFVAHQRVRIIGIVYHGQFLWEI